jgi:hypothetical protein
LSKFLYTIFLGLQTEGIFRLSGSVKKVKELEQIFDSPEQQWGATLLWDGYTVHDTANILRRFLNFLPNPVITHQLYQPFRDVMSKEFFRWRWPLMQ